MYNFDILLILGNKHIKMITIIYREKSMQKSIEILQQIIDESQNIVFFGGAGVSTESGIPDFRSTDGLYNQKYRFPPEVILSHDFFFSNMESARR